MSNSKDITEILFRSNHTALREYLEQLTREEKVALLNKLKQNDGSMLGWSYNNTTAMTYDEQLLEYSEYRLSRRLLLILPPILIILGTFGNLLTFLVLRGPAMRKFSTYFYLMILAVADILVLYIGLLPRWIGEVTGYVMTEKSDWTCKTVNAMGSTVSDLSVWLIIAVTVERYIAVCFPLRASTTCTVSRAIKVSALLFVVFFLLNSHFFWTVSIVYYVQDSQLIARCDGGKHYKQFVEGVWPWLDMFMYSLLPFLIIVALNGFIISQVIRAKQQRLNMQNMQSKGGRGQRVQNKAAQESNIRLTLMLLTVSFAFLVTTMPMTLVSIAAAFLNNEKSNLSRQSKFDLARTITQMLMYINHCMNFYLYCATGEKFRNYLRRLICCGRRSLILARYNMSDHNVTEYMPYSSDRNRSTYMVRSEKLKHIEFRNF